MIYIRIKKDCINHQPLKNKAVSNQTMKTNKNTTTIHQAARKNSSNNHNTKFKKNKKKFGGHNLNRNKF
jgi:hypothetical protein